MSIDPGATEMLISDFGTFLDLSAPTPNATQPGASSSDGSPGGGEADASRRMAGIRTRTEVRGMISGNST